METKTVIRALFMTAMLALPLSTKSYALNSLATPTGGVVVGGSSALSSPSAGTLNITQTTDRSVINWDTFNIGVDAKTQFFQPGASSLSVERVTGGNPAQILGTLKANGNVMILDGNGILFGKGAVVNVNGIVASAGDISPAQVMSAAGPIQISHMGDASVENSGSITVADTGLAAFIAPKVTNSGTIIANLGKITLGAGDNALVDFTGDGLISIAVDSHLTHAFISNSGTITAHGGQIEMTARTAAGIVDNAINNSGIIEATSLTMKGGEIILNGGDHGHVSAGGTLDASGATGGGQITIRGYNVAVSGKVRAQSIMSGQGGTITLAGTHDMSIDGAVKASGINGGGTIDVTGHDLAVSNTGYVVSEATGTGQGGVITLAGTHDTSIDGVVKASGINGGGTIDVTGHDLAIGNTGYTVAEATGAGQGGDITLNGTHNTSVYGIVKATGINGGGTINIAGRDISVGDTGTLVAEATGSGAGGTVALSSVNNTRLSGIIKAGGIDNGGAITVEGNSIYTDATTVLKAKGPATSIGGTIGLTARTLVELAGGAFNTQSFSISSPTVDFSGDTHTTNADLSLNAGTINLGALILDGGNSPIVDPLRFTSNAPAVTVLSNSALVQQGIDLAGNGAVVTIDSGNYSGSLTIDRPLTLQGDGSLPTLGVTTPQSAVVTVAADDVTIRGLNIDGNGSADGIRLTGNNDVTITNNSILDSGTGLDASAFGNGNITLAGNTFTDNTLGARLGSGLIDLTGAANTFSGGNAALLFQRAMSGLQFADLTLANDTLGSTVFTGQTGVNTGRQDVDFENGAFFAPGDPTHIDGRDAVYDGVSGGALTASQLQVVQDRLHDFNDDPTEGLIFFGAAASVQPGLPPPLLQLDPLGRPILSVADKVINYDPPFEPIETLTLNADVSIKLQTPNTVALGTGTLNPSTLASIEPAAGGNQVNNNNDITCANNFLDNRPCAAR